MGFRLCTRFRTRVVSPDTGSFIVLSHLVSYRWRFHADRLCDAALREVFPTASSCTGQDLLGSMITAAAANPAGTAAAFMTHAYKPLPEPIRTTQKQLNLGCKLYVERCMDINQALLNMSLAGGFSRLARCLTRHSFI